MLKVLLGPMIVLSTILEREIVFGDGRYVTKLPFRPDHKELKDNLQICKGRL